MLDRDKRAGVVLFFSVTLFLCFLVMRVAKERQDLSKFVPLPNIDVRFLTSSIHFNSWEQFRGKSVYDRYTPSLERQLCSEEEWQVKRTCTLGVLSLNTYSLASIKGKIKEQVPKNNCVIGGTDFSLSKTVDDTELPTYSVSKMFPWTL